MDGRQPDEFRNRADSLTNRIVLELRGIRVALEALSSPKPEGPKLDKDTQAVALLLTMENPTKGKIARALGYANVNGLRRLKKFCKAWERHEIASTVTIGNGRSLVRHDGGDDFGDDEP